MVKKCLVCIFVLVFCFAAVASSAVASDTNYKIKRLAKELYSKRTMSSAVRKLSSYGTEATEYVLPVLDAKNNDSARVAALQVLAKVNDPSAEDQVAALLGDRNPRIRKEAAKTLSVIMVKDTSVNQLRSLLGDYSPLVRRNAVKALGKLARQQDTDVFIAALRDFDPQVRMEGVIALGKIKSKEAVPYLTELVRDYSVEVRMALVDTFAAIDTTDCVQPLVWLMRDPVPPIRSMAVEKLGDMKAKGVEEALMLAADSPDPLVAAPAIVSLAKVGSKNALGIAKNKLGDEHMDVKIASVEVIGMMGNKQDVPLLQELLTAESTRVREQAREAIVEVNGRV